MEKINGRYRIKIPCPKGISGCAVCHYVWIDEEIYDQIHDCYYDFYGKKPDPTSVVQIHKHLPRDIHLLAEEWGWNDTEVGEKIYKWLREECCRL
ncbi:hypothetical protein NST56_10615 [Bacillus sp. FSL R5-0560]|uniref:hypothetical protein n=1 Tax=Bacillus sp. FSL R5-0560 TaxID=2954588 RepID=UPI0030D29DAB